MQTEKLLRQYSLISHLSFKIQYIDENIRELTDLKDKTVSVLEEKKQELQKGEPEAEKAAATEKALIEAYGGLKEQRSLIKVKKVSIEKVHNELQEIEKEILRLKGIYDEAVKNLNAKKVELKQGLVQIGELDVKIREIAKQILQEKGIAVPDGQKIVDLEKEKAKLQQERQGLIESISSSLDELQKKQRDTMSEMAADEVEIGLRRLGVSGTDEMEDALLDLIRRAEMLFGKKWEDMTPQERMMALLQLRGLHVTPSGHIRTASGRIITLEELRNLLMLEDLDWETLMKMIQPKEEEESEKEICPIVSTTSSKTLTKATTETSSRESVLMSSEDILYLKEFLGKPLTMALAEITAKQPRDPIHYLGQWLFKYRLNEETDIIKKRELEELIEERNRLMKEKLHQMLTEEARAIIMEAIIRAEEQAIRNEIERELRRLQMESMEEEYYDEARDVLGVYDGPQTRSNLPYL